MSQKGEKFNFSYEEGGRDYMYIWFLDSYTCRLLIICSRYGVISLMVWRNTRYYFLLERCQDTSGGFETLFYSLVSIYEDGMLAALDQRSFP
jgi:hypothetical protein